MMVFGRTAMNEAVLKGSLQDQWRIRRGGKLIHAEALRLDGEIAQKLSQVASATSSICLSTILYISRDAEACVNAVRIFFKDYPEVKTAVTAWDGKLIIRSLGNDTAQLKKLLAQFIEQFRKIANPRVWNY
jgi:urease accessory protein